MESDNLEDYAVSSHKQSLFLPRLVMKLKEEVWKQKS